MLLTKHQQITKVTKVTLIVPHTRHLVLDLLSLIKNPLDSNFIFKQPMIKVGLRLDEKINGKH